MKDLLPPLRLLAHCNPRSPINIISHHPWQTHLCSISCQYRELSAQEELDSCPCSVILQVLGFSLIDNLVPVDWLYPRASTQIEEAYLSKHLTVKLLGTFPVVCPWPVTMYRSGKEWGQVRVLTSREVLHARYNTLKFISCLLKSFSHTCDLRILLKQWN